MPTTAAAVGAGETGDGVSLVEELPDDRTVFSQARGEDEHSHLRRYASRSAGGACFCERDRESGTVEFGECAGSALREELEDHVDERVRVENGESVEDDGDVDEEIERRLDALGYK